MIESLVGIDFSIRLWAGQSSHYHCDELWLLSEAVALWPCTSRQRCVHLRTAGTRHIHSEVLWNIHTSSQWTHKDHLAGRMAADLEFTQQNWPRVCLTSWSLKLHIGHMCMYSLRGGLLVCMQNHALMASSNAHVVLPHFGCVPTYFGSSAVKASVLAAAHCCAH